jgi:acetyl-CoA carboxylase carboxyl transferase subunit alpha
MEELSAQVINESKLALPVLEFEKPVVELEKKILELQKIYPAGSKQITKMMDQLAELKKETYRNLSPWNRVQIARHPKRPYTLDYIRMMTTDFVELHGDRAFKDDPAIVAGMARLNGRSVFIIGHQKGRDIKENIHRNFGMPNPEGYRKALRVMKLAEKFNRPLLLFNDTPGAFPGIGAEERGQAEAIARNLREMAMLRVPIIVAVIGEGASGGALGIGVGDRVLMLENAWYNVISPEGCAAILWSDRAKAEEMAKVMKLTAADLQAVKVVDRTIPEPVGGAHRFPKEMAAGLRKALVEEFNALCKMEIDDLVERRIQKYCAIGEFVE